MPEANQEKIQTNYHQYQPEELLNQEVQQQNPEQIQSHSNFHSEMSFVSLTLGVLGLIFPLFSTLAIVTGIAGFIQIHRTNLKGKWMAITGIILGVFGIVLFFLAIFFGFSFIQEMIPVGFEEQLAGMMQ